MEDGLGDCSSDKIAVSYVVLILVLVEDGLGVGGVEVKNIATLS